MVFGGVLNLNYNSAKRKLLEGIAKPDCQLKGLILLGKSNEHNILQLPEIALSSRDTFNRLNNFELPPKFECLLSIELAVREYSLHTLQETEAVHIEYVICVLPYKFVVCGKIGENLEISCNGEY